MTFLTAKEVAEKARVTIRTVRRWHKRGLRKAREGRGATYHVDDVDAFLRSNTSTSGATRPSGGSPSVTP